MLQEAPEHTRPSFETPLKRLLANEGWGVICLWKESAQSLTPPVEKAVSTGFWK